MIRLVAGLGNPGEGYARTRHNVGFVLLDRLAEKLGAPTWTPLSRGWTLWKRRLGEYFAAEVSGRKVLFARPLTYMNESGKFLGELARYSNVAPGETLIAYDDFALPLGRIRLRLKGSAGGHNGMQSALDHLGTDEVPRLRIGIGPAPGGQDPKDFVLGRFKPAERDSVTAALDLAASAVLASIEDGVEAAMNRFNPEAKA